MRKRLSQKAVDNLKGPGGKVCWDLRNPGFGVAIGARFNSYIVQRRVDRATRRITLGRCGDLTYEQALHHARDLLCELEHRRVPRQLTLGEALEEYIASRKDNIRPKTADGYRYALRKYAGDWLGLAVAKITPEMVRLRHTKIGETTGRTGTKLTSTANGLMRTLRVVLNFARDRDPTVGTNAVSVGLRRSMYMDRRREGHVTEDELAEFWAQAEALPSRTISSFIRLVLATGMRSHECRYLRWEWVGANWIIVPAEHTKGKRTLRVPVTTLVRMILAERRASISPDVPWVFPARVAGRPLQEPKKAFKQITVRRVTPHDLRRTYITMAREAGTDLTHLKMLVGHKATDITETYNMVSDRHLAASAQEIANLIAERAGIAIGFPEIGFEKH